jgi:hypothetical protein
MNKSLTRSQLQELAKRRDALEQMEKLKKPGPYPADPDEQNDDRASWAETALLAFMVETGTDADTAIMDLTCDLLHWCDRHNVVFDQQLERGRGHYQEETRPETDEVI